MIITTAQYIIYHNSILQTSIAMLCVTVVFTVNLRSDYYNIFEKERFEELLQNKEFLKILKKEKSEKTIEK